MAGVAPHFQQYTGNDPLGDVVSWNLKRRQLSTSQKAALAVALKPEFEAQARERMEAGTGADGSGGRGHEKNPVANLPEGLRSRDQAAAAVGVSGRIVQDAESVKDVPGLARAALENVEFALNHSVGNDDTLRTLAGEAMAAAKLLEFRTEKLAKALQKMITAWRKAHKATAVA